MGMFSRTQSEVPNPEVGGDTPKPPESAPAGGKSDAQLLAETVTGAITKLGETVNGIVSKVDALEQRFQQKTTQTNEEHKPTQFASVFEDEDAAIGQRVVAAVGPMYQQQLEMQADINREKVVREFVNKGFGPTLEKFEQRINSLLDGTPLVRADGKAWRGDKEYIRNTINMVIGEAATAAGLKFDAKGGNFFIEGASGGDGGTSVSAPNDGLTEGQRKLFTRMKVPAAEAQKTIGKLKFVN